MGKRRQDRADRAVESPRISRAIALTRIAMWWEEAARAFWPVAVVLAAVFSALAFGLAESLSRVWLVVTSLVAVAAFLLTLIGGLRRYRHASRDAARARVDARLPGRPLSALRDEIALGDEDPGAAALWQAHLRQMRIIAEQALRVRADADLPRRDPYALRLIALTALVMAMLFAPSGQFGQGVAALAASLRPAGDSRPPAASGPGWEGWAEPPAYTRRPTLYLNAWPEGERLVLPKGTVVSFRLYGETAQLQQDIGPEIDTPDPAAPRFLAERDGLIDIADRRFPITVQPDSPPRVAPGAAPTRRADGRLIQQFTAGDDNGVAAGRALVRLDLAAVDRRYGLAAEPEPRPELELALPLPATGQRKEIAGQLVADLARHAWANLPVTIRLEVVDGIEQVGTSDPMRMVLPGRRFFDPLAAALIELRRDLLWSRRNGPGSAGVLRSVVWQPEGFMDEDLARVLRGVIGRLEQGPLETEERDELAELLWLAAVELEDGGLADALERMQQAQQRLSEAIRQGASEDEIRKLMDELREATDAYTDMLAEQGEDPAQRFDRSPRDQQQRITGDQIQQMMDEIQRLMNEGRMAEAQELLEQFNRMMQNLRVTEGTDPDDAARQRPLNRLADTLRDQQQLSDDALRELQDRFMPRNDGEDRDRQDEQQGSEEPQEQDGQSLAERQRALREDLGRQRGLLPGTGSEQGDEAARQLDQAGRAMEEAEEALRNDDIAGAMERQAQAIQSMREGMRALGEMQGQQGQQGQDGAPGQQGQQGGAGDPSGQRGLALPHSRQPQTDPLGRSMTGQGGSVATGDPLAEEANPGRQARGLLDEIRRRLSDRDRAADERDYLGRLLDRF